MYLDWKTVGGYLERADLPNTFVDYRLGDLLLIQSRPKVICHYRVIKKSYQIVSKPIRILIRQIIVSVKRYTIIRWY